MAHPAVKLPAVAQRELESCCLAGMSARATRLRLGACGFWLAERTLARRMAEWREEHARREQRSFDLQEIGRGLARFNSEIGGALSVCDAALPDWRAKHLEMLTQGFQDFLSVPTQDGFNGVVTGCFTFLVYSGIANPRGSSEFALKSDTAKEGTR